MSSPGPRISIDSLVSPTSTPQRGQYPFPQVPLSPGFSPRARHDARRGSAASSVGSIGGALNSLGQNRNQITPEYGQNAISTLLQQPIIRTGLSSQATATSSTGYKAPTTKDIPPVTLTNIPHVDASEFRTYLSQVGSLYDAFRRAKQETADHASQTPRGGHDGRQGDGSLGRSWRRQSQDPTRVGSIDSGALSPLASPRPDRRQGGGSRRTGHAVTPLSAIPSVYFEQDFHLENPRTFDVVSERSDVVRPLPPRPGDKAISNGSVVTPAPSGRKALATNAILQEKLSWYMDTVEVHLISAIATASSSFFAALGSLRELHAEAADSVKRIRSLRDDLAQLDENMAVGGLKIVNLRQRRENLRKLGEAVNQLKAVVEGVSKCRELVDRGDIEQALGGVEGIEKLLAAEGAINANDKQDDSSTHQAKPIDLQQVKALSGVRAELDSLRSRIGKAFEITFLEAMLGDLKRHVTSVPASQTIQRWAIAAQRNRGDNRRPSSAVPLYLSLDEGLRTLLRANMNGLCRSHYVRPATTAYRDAVLREMKSLIRRNLPSSTDDDTESMTSVSTRGGGKLNQQDKSSILARNLRALDASDAEDLLARIYSAFGEALRRLGVQAKVLLDITSDMEVPAVAGGSGRSIKSSTKEVSMSIQEEVHQSLDISGLLGQAVDAAQTQIAKILRVRTEQTTRLSIPDFLRYFTLNRLFADECEAVSGRGGTPLKTVVNAHIRDFVTHLGDSERQSLAQIMDADQWDAKDFGDEEIRILTRISEASIQDSEIWTRDVQSWAGEPPVMAAPLTNGTGENNTANGKDKVRSAVLDEQKFILPKSAISLLRGVERFEHLIACIPSMTADISTNLVEYLKLFNSRSCQLILGAGATRSAGLKNITTKHLALASQALSFILALHPYIREFVRRHAGTAASRLIPEFDKVQRLYQEHQQGIHDKLVEIMSGRATAHVNAMKKIRWDDEAASAADGGGAAGAYMETLTKETSTLHRVLSKHLPETTVLGIMRPVFSSYRDQWGKAFGDVDVQTARGKDRLLRDAEYFRQRLSKLDGAGDLGDYVVNIVQAKTVDTPIAVAQTGSGGEELTEDTGNNEGTASAEAETLKDGDIAGGQPAADDPPVDETVTATENAGT
ncbi:MAG: Vacuolar protein sorting-associated protein 54 [Caeruleum heppii]|nr:MAG: Vacuolar protein sorting-associated protein 54 [Caeruleum heppii]